MFYRLKWEQGNPLGPMVSAGPDLAPQVPQTIALSPNAMLTEAQELRDETQAARDEAVLARDEAKSSCRLAPGDGFQVKEELKNM